MSLLAGAAEIDITPGDSQFLFGYPHVKRYSTGVHDPLYCSALVVKSTKECVAFVTCDVIFVDKEIVAEARGRIQGTSSVPPENVFISTTHTHSGPITVDHASNEGDPVVPRADVQYRAKLIDAIVEAVVTASRRLVPGKIGLGVGDATGVGTNRRDPTGPADMTVPILYVTDADDAPLACMIVCSMHPTVLHEDSTEVSADFPGYARGYVKREYVGENTPFLYHTGPAGNQSPRHVTKGNTFAEAKRLGEIVGTSVVDVLASIELRDDIEVEAVAKEIELRPRVFPPVGEAEASLKAATTKLDRLRASDAPPTEVRTAEVDWFGAEETLTLSRLADEGRLEAYIKRCMPAEVMVASIGPWHFVGIPGELFIEYSLEIKQRCADSFIVSLANGELQGYIVTEEAVALGGYESSNALFHHSSGDTLVSAALELLGCK
jgi:neutral ceramidase